MLIDKYAVAGRTSNVGFKGWGSSPTGAGSGGAGAAGDSTHAAGSGASADAIGGAGGGGNSAAAGSAGDSPLGAAGATQPDGGVEPDPLDVFGLGSGGAPALSCEGLPCFEFADCQNLYPDEQRACSFTRCEDLSCQ